MPIPMVTAVVSGIIQNSKGTLIERIHPQLPRVIRKNFWILRVQPRGSCIFSCLQTIHLIFLMKELAKLLPRGHFIASGHCVDLANEEYTRIEIVKLCHFFFFFFFFNKIKPNFIHLLTEIRILKFFLMLQSELEINPTCSQFTIRRTTFVPEPLRTSTRGKMARNRWKKFVDDLLTLVAKSRFGYSCWTTQHPRTGWGSFHQ